MEGVKRTASNNWSLVFQIALKSAEGSWQFCLEKFWPFSAFVMLQIRFCNHRVIKSSMIYLYIKPEVKKMIQQQRCSNKWSLYWVITWKLLFGEETFSGVGNDLFFLLAAGRAQSTGFSPNGRFRGSGRAVHTWWGQ